METCACRMEVDCLLEDGDALIVKAGSVFLLDGC